MKTERIIPCSDRVVIQPNEAETKTPGGIVLPDAAQEKTNRGKTNTFGFVTGTIRDADGNVVATGAFADKVTAQRLVDCVNACEDIPTKHLKEHGVIQRAPEVVAEVEDSDEPT